MEITKKLPFTIIVDNIDKTRCDRECTYQDIEDLGFCTLYNVHCAFGYKRFERCIEEFGL